MKYAKLIVSILLTIGIIGVFLYMAIFMTLDENKVMMKDTEGLTPIIGHTHNII